MTRDALAKRTDPGWMVVRKRDTYPPEVWHFSDEGEARSFHDRAQQQWSECYLLRVVKQGAQLDAAEDTQLADADSRYTSARLSGVEQQGRPDTDLAPAQSGWQPIATAPKDGTVMIRPHRIWGAMDVRYIAPADAERVSVLPGGIPWEWLNGDYTNAWTETAFFPYWMPLPPPPKETP